MIQLTLYPKRALVSGNIVSVNIIYPDTSCSSGTHVAGQLTLYPKRALVSGNIVSVNIIYPDTSCSSGTHVAGQHVSWCKRGFSQYLLRPTYIFEHVYSFIYHKVCWSHSWTSRSDRCHVWMRHNAAAATGRTCINTGMDRAERCPTPVVYPG